WSAILTIEKLGERSPDNPWLLTLPPAGYDPGAYQWMRGVGGVPLADNHYRFSSDQWYSYIEGWRMPNGKHVLESMNIADREENERKHIARTLGALYYGQHVLGRTEWGLSTKTFHEGFPAKYTLADFGTSTRMGDMPLPSLLYMREGRRMVNDRVFGGKFMENQGTDAYCRKTYWHPRSFYFNAMNIDIHGVTNRFVEGSGPEGMQIPRFLKQGFGVCCIPFDVCIPRPSEATGLLVASAGAYTHQAYSAFPRMEPGRFQIGAGCAMAAYTALRDGVSPHEVDVEKVQLRGLIESGRSIVFFDDAMPGTENHVIDQMLGARGVPLQNAQGIYISEAAFSNAEMLECLENFFLKYAENPAKRGRFDPITKILRENPDKRAEWGTALPILATLTGFDESGNFDALLKQCSDAGYLKCGRNPNAKTALHFSIFKRLLFNLALCKKSPQGPYPVEEVSPVVRDTFNRKDSPVEKPEIGPKYVPSSPWEVKGGLAVPTQTEADSFLWIPCEAKEFTAACDIFLEQTRTEATAGLAFRKECANEYVRFVVRTDRFDVLILLERVTGDSVEPLAKKRLETKLRGFTLRAHRERDILYCVLGHETAFPVPFRESIFEVGFYNGSGNKNLFDNFEIINY
ncbi:MAG TPA: FAD-dependent oxidoreductase, partial [bacterium]|nr:FAD-dependent oxidoreductase [bacterium]